MVEGGPKDGALVGCAARDVDLGESLVPGGAAASSYRFGGDVRRGLGLDVGFGVAERDVGDADANMDLPTGREGAKDTRPMAGLWKAFWD